MAKQKQSEYVPWHEQLLDPRWQKLRLEVMQRDEFTCTECGCKTDTLNVHHKKYDKGRKAWEYPPETLVTLCELCHKARHDLEGRLRDALAVADTTTLAYAVGYVKGRFAIGMSERVSIANHEEIVGAAESVGVPAKLLEDVLPVDGVIDGFFLDGLQVIYHAVCTRPDEKEKMRIVFEALQVMGFRQERQAR